MADINLLIQVDALREDYLTDQCAPFLSSLGRQGITGKLQPAFGFEPDAAYLAGLHPDECDGGAHYWYEPEASPFRVARRLPAALDRLPFWPKKVVRRLLREWVRRSTACRHASVANIPLDVLPFVAPAQRNLPWEPGYPGRPNVFSLCDAHGIPWWVHAAPSHPVQVDAGLERLVRDLEPPVGFAFWHIGDLDKAGHRYGPGSPERRAAIRKVDAAIRDAYMHLKRHYERVRLVVMGDHGMAPVRGTVDVQERLDRAGIAQGSGVLYFLDSTMARFWFFDQGAARRVRSALAGLRGGRVLDRADRERYHLNYTHDRFGSLYFLADPGVLVSPNFYQDRGGVKGMHGYAPECPDQQSAFIISAPGLAASHRIYEPVDMRRIFPTVLKLLGLDKPSTCRVESIV